MQKDISATDFYKAATTTAEHFGFTTLDEAKKRLPKDKKSKLDHAISANDKKLDNLYGLLLGGASYFADSKLHHLEEPILFYTNEQVPRSGNAAFSLHIFGVEKSIAEAILIQTSRALAEELGYTDTTVRINSLGDQESIVRYNKELTNFLRKRLETIPPPARELMKEHPFFALMYLIDNAHEYSNKSPSPLEHLSDQSRKHFREVIEYLDMGDIPYEIDNKLLGHYDCFSDTLFSIEQSPEQTDEEDVMPLSIRGGRYTSFTNKYLKMPVHAAGTVVILNDKKAPQRTPKSLLPKNPTVHIVQLGFGPKIRCLMLIDTLRKAGITVKQQLASDSLSEQLRIAEEDNAIYTIIIGQKEYVDGNVILRDMLGRNQESIPMTDLTAKIKRLIK